MVYEQFIGQTVTLRESDSDQKAKIEKFVDPKRTNHKVVELDQELDGEGDTFHVSELNVVDNATGGNE
jgi:hypothetical protein